MNDENMRNSIRDAIRAAPAAGSGGGFAQWASNLLAVLGYRSERAPDGQTGDVNEFIADFPALKPSAQSERNLRSSAASIRILFQFTNTEIAETAPSALLDAAAFDSGNAESFIFAAVELNGETYSRSKYAEFTREVNKRLPMPIVILFRAAAGRLTLAFVHRRVNKRNIERDVLGSVSLIREIDPVDPHRAHIDALAELTPAKRLQWMGSRGKPRNFDGLLDAWLDALDARELNRKFYRELFAWFERAVAKTKFPAGVPPEEHVIRLITRLLFVWFIKQKRLIAEELFVENEIRRLLKDYDRDAGDSYYRAVLQNLFFATLNTEIDQRRFSKESNADHRDFSRYRYRDEISGPDRLIALFARTPFINGGLFDCLDSYEAGGKGGRRIDCFTDNRNHRKLLSIPNRLFFDPEAGLFPLFNRYKFTVEENTPVEREAALDPELLGRVFENLLAAYNPETRRTARKATGSYYTPRPVVDYMVDEALTAALTQRCKPTDGDDEFWRERLRYLLDYNDAGELFDSDETEAVVRAVAGLRVLDPAVGSGAFPMSVLHKLTLALRRLDPDNELWKELQKDQARRRAGAAFDADDRAERERQLAAISDNFERYRRSDFGRKLYLIQNGIYGVDIQPIACRIAQLRFFISLTIEQEPDPAAPNYGIKPLPNLETRFVAANALLGLDKPAQSTLGQTDAVKQLERRLKENRERHFHVNNRQKKLECRNKDRELRDELAAELRAGGMPAGAAEKVARWNPYDQNAVADWFDAEYMFGLADGFDIVIGNPPYVRGEKIAGKARLRAAFGDFYKGTADLYAYFFKKGVEFLAANGLLCFITSNKFMRAAYGQPLRAFLKREAPPVFLLDMGRTGAFDATVRPAIMLAGKGGSRKALRAATVREKDGVTDDLRAFMEESGFLMSFAALSDKGWSLAEPALLRLRGKIEKAGAPLREYLKEGLYRGIITGLNEAFVIDAQTRKRLIAEDPNSAELIRPWLRGRDVRRRRADWAGLYVIAIASSANKSWPWSSASPAVDAVAIFKKTYPAVHGHLSRFEDKLCERQDKGRFFWELRACAYYEAFDQPKIIYADIGTEMRALLDRDGRLTGNTCYIIPGDDGYLLALLNAKLLDFYFRLAMPCLDDPFSGGDMRFFRVDMERTPIAAAGPAKKDRLAALSNAIQTAKQADPAADTSAPEREIDRIVYDLYGLDASETALIEKTAER